MATILRRFVATRDSRSGVSIVTLGIPLSLFVLLVATTPRFFLSWENLTNLSGQMTALLIVALGQLLVALMGGLDLSVGSVMSVATCIVSSDGSLALTIPLVIALGVAVGLVNGYGVVVFGIHPIVMTLSSMTFLQGVAYLIRTVPGGHIPALLTLVASGRTLGVPYSLGWSVACALAVAVVLYRSRFGLHVFAVGGNPMSARLNGVPARRVAISAYVACSLLAVIAGLFLAARTASGDPAVGTSFGLDSVTAIALGGTQLSGGVGGVVGAITGTVSLGLVSNGMNLLNVSPFLQSAFKGVLLIVAICAQRRTAVGL
ncbi:MAG: ABC transporter permease [Candidatus Eremiobacteraeota bacterium]|nr:ABC transporter permease [Candidatus Eremiobacteraeota bacterium]